MVETVESQFKLSDGLQLYMKKWIPAGSPVAKLVFIHGFSDHCNRYYELFPSLASRGILVIGFDQRGWGRTVKKPSEKGLTGPTAQVLSDIAEVLESELPSAVPVFLMGHSMGGGEVLTFVSTPKYEALTPSLRGIILESPFIAMAHKANPLTVFVGRLVGKLAPHHQINQAIPPKDLTRDPEVIKSLEEDPMCDGTGTLEMFANMLDRAAGLEKGTLRLNKGVQAVWLGHGTHDLATSYAASKKWLEAQEALKDKTFKSYDGWYHQLHGDLPDLRLVFAKDVGDWILARVGGDAAVATATATKEPETEAENVTPAAAPPADTSAETPVISEATNSSTLPVEEQAKL